MWIILRLSKEQCIVSEPGTPGGNQSQSTVIPTKVITQSVVRQTVGTPQTGATSHTYTESQINDFVSKCRTFLTTLLRLAEKQAPEKLPMVRSCIQQLLVLERPILNTQSINSFYMI